MSYERLEIRQWGCQRRACEATATTIGTEDSHGLPDGWVATDESEPHHYCSEEHAREQAAADVEIIHPWHRAIPFALAPPSKP